MTDIDAVRRALYAVWEKHNLAHGYTGLDEPGFVADIIAAVREHGSRPWNIGVKQHKGRHRDGQ